MADGISVGGEPAPAGGQAGRRRGGRKIFGVPVWAATLGIVVTAGGIAYYVYRQRKAAAAGSSGQAGGSTGQICYDSQGNTVPCTDASAVTDQSGEISTLQTEIGDLQGELAGGGSGGTTGGTGTGSGTGGSSGGGTPNPGGPMAGGTKTISVGGPHATKDLYYLAKQYGISEAQLLKLNPQLKKYEGSKKPIPVKTKIKVPK